MKTIKIIAVAVVAIGVLLAIIFLADSVETKSDNIVIGDRYFTEQLFEILNYPKANYGKTIEIEGFPITRDGVTVVARFGTCCPEDEYLFLEYEYEGDIELVEIQDWIKVTGELRERQDSFGSIYIKATSVEKMPERGQDTVT
jgi:uncharacterized membrane protein YcgQ (UPF0703/DUF1980 family)